MGKKGTKEQYVKVGVGEAVSRLIHLNHMLGAGVADVPARYIDERNMLVDALNHIKLDLAFDVDGDGVPDTIDIFRHAAHTGEARIIHLDHEHDQRRTHTPFPDAPQKKPKS